MNKIIALALLTGATYGHASERNIFDIMYLPDAGTTYGSTTGEYAMFERDSDELGDIDFEGYGINQTLGHAFTDRLSLQASLNYVSLEADPEGGDEFDSAKGLSDPSVFARFRTMDERFRWDIIGGATINIMDREVEDDRDTNNVQGGHSLHVGTQFGVKTEIFQWALGALLSHNLESETEFETAGEDVDVESDANNELLLRGDILNKLANNSYLRSHLSVNFTEEFEDDQEPPETEAPTTTYDIGTEYQHLVSEDVLLRAGVDYSTTNVRTGQIDDATGWTYRAGVDYQF